jgi:hypothetical protein
MTAGRARDRGARIQAGAAAGGGEDRDSVSGDVNAAVDGFAAGTLQEPFAARSSTRRDTPGGGPDGPRP